ncbi:hypothetical protein ACF05L_19050 [Streptomyces bobili]|uniref:hypothetical protein n=1 Tax=Streptomyces bobili TaxID=67280 RepID=UPI0036F70154
MEQFAPVPVTLPWDDPTPAETPVEAKHRRPRTYSLLVTGRERKAINRNYFNSCGWKPALATAGVIAPLEEGNTNGARVWEPSREHGFHALRHFYAFEELEAGESVVSLARWLGHSDPGFTLGSTPTSCPARAHEAAPPSTRFSRSRGPVGRTCGAWLVANRGPKVPEMPPHPSLTR